MGLEVGEGDYSRMSMMRVAVPHCINRRRRRKPTRYPQPISLMSQLSQISQPIDRFFQHWPKSPNRWAWSLPRDARQLSLVWLTTYPRIGTKLLANRINLIPIITLQNVLYIWEFYANGSDFSFDPFMGEHFVLFDRSDYVNDDISGPQGAHTSVCIARVAAVFTGDFRTTS